MRLKAAFKLPSSETWQRPYRVTLPPLLYFIFILCKVIKIMLFLKAVFSAIMQNKIGEDNSDGTVKRP